MIYVFLCKMKFNQKILNDININKKIKELANDIETNFINKYKNEYNLIKYYE